MSERQINWAIVGLGDIVRKRVGPALLEQPDRADQLHIVGTEASIAFSAVDGIEMTITRGRDSERIELPRHANAHYGLIDDFAAAIREGRAPRFDGVDGLAATRIIDLMSKSSATGGWVETAP